MWTFYHPNGRKAMNGRYVNGSMSGEWNLYNTDGSLSAKGPYADGSQKGIWTYYERGRVKSRLTVNSGMADGKGWLYENGRLSGEGMLSGLPTKPKKSGMFREYYPNGKVRSEGEWMMNKKSGGFKEFYSSGALMAEGRYMNNKKNEMWKFYLKDGRTQDKEKTGYYMNGKLNKKLSKGFMN